jgi:F1F0 ATPase subunit 2
MNEAIYLFLSLLAGALLGLIFFAGLWWTLKMGLISERPALWFMSSFFLRVSIVLTGFYMISQTDWKYVLLSLLGFLIARIYLTRKLPMTDLNTQKEIKHAP